MNFKIGGPDERMPKPIIRAFSPADASWNSELKVEQPDIDRKQANRMAKRVLWTIAPPLIIVEQHRPWCRAVSIPIRVEKSRLFPEGLLLSEHPDGVTRIELTGKG